MKIKNKKKELQKQEKINNYGEVFTSDREVDGMLGFFNHEIERLDAKFLEPSCGSGNFLFEILNRRLNHISKKYKNNISSFEKSAFISISSIYGIEIQPDNALVCRERLYEHFKKKYEKIFKENVSDKFLNAIKVILDKNIVIGDALSLKDQEDNNITFIEWTIIKNDMIKRNEYIFSDLIAYTPMSQPNLFSDKENKTFVPPVYKDYPLIDLYNLEDF